MSKRDENLPRKQAPKVTVKEGVHTAHCVYKGCTETRKGNSKSKAVQILASHILAMHGDSRYLI